MPHTRLTEREIQDAIDAELIMQPTSHRLLGVLAGLWVTATAIGPHPGEGLMHSYPPTAMTAPPPRAGVARMRGLYCLILVELDVLDNRLLDAQQGAP